MSETDYTFTPAGPGILEVNKWEPWESMPVATYRITDGKCNCPAALYRKGANCKHVRLAKEQGLLKKGNGNENS